MTKLFLFWLINFLVRVSRFLQTSVSRSSRVPVFCSLFDFKNLYYKFRKIPKIWNKLEERDIAKKTKGSSLQWKDFGKPLSRYLQILRVDREWKIMGGPLSDEKILSSRCWDISKIRKTGPQNTTSSNSYKQTIKQVAFGFSRVLSPTCSSDSTHHGWWQE